MLSYHYKESRNKDTTVKNTQHLQHGIYIEAGLWSLSPTRQDINHMRLLSVQEWDKLGIILLFSNIISG